MSGLLSDKTIVYIMDRGCEKGLMSDIYYFILTETLTLKDVTVFFLQSGAVVLERYAGQFSSLSQFTRFNSSVFAVTYQLEYVSHICWRNTVLDQTVCWSRLV